MSTLFGRADASSLKHALIVGFSLFLIALVMTLVSLSLTLPNTAIEVALS